MTLLRGRLCYSINIFIALGLDFYLDVKFLWSFER